MPKVASALAEEGANLGAVDLSLGDRRAKWYETSPSTCAMKRMANVCWPRLERHSRCDRPFRVRSHFSVASRGQDPSQEQTPDDHTQRSLDGLYPRGWAGVSGHRQDKSKAYAFTTKSNSVAVITDGSAVLGLGNLGPEAALPVMEGKAMLFRELAGIDAWPICLATQDPDEIVRTVQAIAPGFGAINLEDIGAPRCFDIERRLKASLDIPVMHDDQHGTAVVLLAALTNALTWSVNRWIRSASSSTDSARPVPRAAACCWPPASRICSAATRKASSSKAIPIICVPVGLTSRPV